jgi:hypothetical protein
MVWEISGGRTRQDLGTSGWQADEKMNPRLGFREMFIISKSRKILAFLNVLSQYP